MSNLRRVLLAGSGPACCTDTSMAFPYLGKCPRHVAPAFQLRGLTIFECPSHVYCKSVIELFFQEHKSITFSIKRQKNGLLFANAKSEGMKEEIERAVEVLRRGGIILYPTDTVWGNRLRCNRRDCGGEGLSTETFLQQEGHDCADREHRPRGMLLQKRPGRSLGSARMCRQAADTHPTRSLRRGEKSGAGGGNACSPRPQPRILPEPAAPIRPAAGIDLGEHLRRGYPERVRRYCRRDTCGCRLHGRYPLRRRSHPQRHPPSSCSERMEK